MSSSDAPIERMFTPVEIGSILKKKTQTVCGWLRDPNHPLNGKKIMNQWYVTESEFKKFLNGGTA